MVAISPQKKVTINLGKVHISDEDQKILEAYRKAYIEQYNDEIPLGDMVVQCAIYGINKDRTFKLPEDKAEKRTGQQPKKQQPPAVAAAE